MENTDAAHQPPDTGPAVSNIPPATATAALNTHAGTAHALDAVHTATAAHDQYQRNHLSAGNPAHRQAKTPPPIVFRQDPGDGVAASALPPMPDEHLPTTATALYTLPQPPPTGTALPPESQQHSSSHVADAPSQRAVPPFSTPGQPSQERISTGPRPLPAYPPVAPGQTHAVQHTPSQLPPPVYPTNTLPPAYPPSGMTVQLLPDPDKQQMHGPGQPQFGHTPVITAGAHEQRANPPRELPSE